MFPQPQTPKSKSTQPISDQTDLPVLGRGQSDDAEEGASVPGVDHAAALAHAEVDAVARRHRHRRHREAALLRDEAAAREGP